MSSSNDNKTTAGTSVVTIIQIIFACCYYLDPCHTDSSKECATIIPHWEQWQVWLPLIISSGLGVVIIIFTSCCYMCCADKENKSAYLTGHITRV